MTSHLPQRGGLPPALVTPLLLAVALIAECCVFSIRLLSDQNSEVVNALPKSAAYYYKSYCAPDSLFFPISLLIASFPVDSLVISFKPFVMFFLNILLEVFNKEHKEEASRFTSKI